MREKFAVLESWKNNLDPLKGKWVIRKYKALQEIPVRDGYIGPMLETSKGSKNFGKTYKGGGHQYETLQKFVRDDVYIPKEDASNIGKTMELIEDFVKTLK